MNVADQEVLIEFIDRYGSPSRPRIFGNPSHCDECSEANDLLMDRTPDDLDPEELAEPSTAWFFSWMGDDGWRYFLPGFVRVALSSPTENFSILLDQLRAEYVSTLSDRQREALHEVLDYSRVCGYASNNQDRQLLKGSLELTRTEPQR